MMFGHTTVPLRQLRFLWQETEPSNNKRCRLSSPISSSSRPTAVARDSLRAVLLCLLKPRPSAASLSSCSCKGRSRRRHLQLSPQLRVSRLQASLEEFDEEGLLSVESVLGLVEDDTLGSVDDLRRLLLTAHGR